MTEPARSDAVQSFLETLPEAVHSTADAHLKSLSLSFDRAGYDRAAFRQAIGDVPVLDDPVSVKRRSRDYYWFSPIIRSIKRAPSLADSFWLVR